MIAIDALWVVFGWLLSAAAVGFAGAWLIQHWRMQDGLRAGRELMEALREAREAPPRVELVDDATLAYWKGDAERLAQEHAAVSRQRDHWQAEAEQQAQALARLGEARDALQIQHREEIGALQQAAVNQRVAHEEALTAAATRHELALAALKAQQADELATIAELHQSALRAREASHHSVLNEVAARHADLIAELESRHAAARDQEAPSVPAGLPDEMDSQARELTLLRTQLGASSERVLDLEQQINRLQLEALGREQQYTEALAAAEAQVQAQVLALAQAVPASATPAVAPAAPAEDPSVQGLLERQRLQELESALARARRQATEHRAEVSGLKGRISDLETRLAELWQQHQPAQPGHARPGADQDRN